MNRKMPLLINRLVDDVGNDYPRFCYTRCEACSRVRLLFHFETPGIIDKMLCRPCLANLVGRLKPE